MISEILDRVEKLVDFALDVVDMAEECRDHPDVCNHTRTYRFLLERTCQQNTKISWRRGFMCVSLSVSELPGFSVPETSAPAVVFWQSKAIESILLR